MSRPILERQSFTQRVARSIRHAMVDKDMNQADLARALGKDEVWLSRRLKGHVILNVIELQAIAAVLDVPAANLLPQDSAAQLGEATVGYRGVPEMRDSRLRRTAPISDPLGELVLPRHRAFSPFEIAGPAW